MSTNIAPTVQSLQTITNKDVAGMPALLAIVTAKITSKGKEYTNGGNPLLLIETAAKRGDVSVQEAINGMMLKHDTSLYLADKGKVPLTNEQYIEKATDLAVYYLLKAYAYERNRGA